MMETHWRLPSESLVQRFAGEGNVLCDIKLVVAMLRNAREAEEAGGDAVFDNLVGMKVDGASSKGTAWHSTTLKFADGETVTGGMIATVSETSAAKAQNSASLNTRYRDLAARMAQAGVPLQVGRGGAVRMGEDQNITLLNLVVATTDRCAAEAGQVKELQQLKASELPLLLGRRFLRSGFGVGLRCVALGAESCAVELEVLSQDESAATKVRGDVSSLVALKRPE